MILNVGMQASIKKTITETDIYNFAGISGDFNWAHIDEEKAKKGPFGERIAHGMLSASFISAVLGTELPGPGTVYLSQSLNFKKPVKIADTIEAVVKVVEIMNKEKGIYKLDTKCLNQYGDIVVDGEAVVKYQDSQVSLENVSVKQDSFYSEEELRTLGLKRYGKNVLISRNAVIYNPSSLEIGNHVRIDDFTTISGKVVLGDYIHIAQFCGLYGGEEGIFMDDFTGLSSRVAIYATSNDYSGNSMTNPMVPAKYKTTDKSFPVHLEKHVIIGCTSVVLPGVTIGIGSSVGAMSMVSKSLEPWGVYAGSPAKKIKERSKKLLVLEDQLRKECKLES